MILLKSKKYLHFFKNACPPDKYLSTFIKSVCYFKINPFIFNIINTKFNYFRLIK